MSNDVALEAPSKYTSHLYAALIIALVCSGLFVIVASLVFRGATLTFDQAILNTIHSWSTPFWDNFFMFITNFGDVLGVAIISLTLLAMLLRRKMYKRATMLTAGVFGAVLLNLVLKLIFERPRPDLWEQLIIETSFSFPSGHAMASSALAFSIIIIFWRTRYRTPVTIIAVTYFLLIGFSRLYLGVHYPTDVLAGWLASGAVVATAWLVLNWRRASFKP